MPTRTEPYHLFIACYTVFGYHIPVHFGSHYQQCHRIQHKVNYPDMQVIRSYQRPPVGGKGCAGEIGYVSTKPQHGINCWTQHGILSGRDESPVSILVPNGNHNDKNHRHQS